MWFDWSVLGCMSIVAFGISMYFHCCDWYLVRGDIAVNSMVRDTPSLKLT